MVERLLQQDQHHGKAGWGKARGAGSAGALIAAAARHWTQSTRMRHRPGDTALHLASRNGRSKCLRRLLEVGACCTALNEDAKTPQEVCSAHTIWLFLDGD